MKRAKNRQLQHCVGARGTTVPLAGSCVAVRPSSRRVQPPAGAAGAAANTCGCSSCPGHVQQGRPRAPAPCGHDAPTHPALRNRRQLVPKQPCRHANLQQAAVVIVGSKGHSSLVLAQTSSGTPQILTGTGRAVGVPWWPPCSGLLPPCCQRAAMHKPHSLFLQGETSSRHGASRKEAPRSRFTTHTSSDRTRRGQRGALLAPRSCIPVLPAPLSHPSK